MPAPFILEAFSKVVVDGITFTVQPTRALGFLGFADRQVTTPDEDPAHLARAEHGQAAIGSTRYREEHGHARTGWLGSRRRPLLPGRPTSVGKLPVVSQPLVLERF
jgi:hypothetical protein